MNAEMRNVINWPFARKEIFSQLHEIPGSRSQRIQSASNLRTSSWQAVSNDHIHSSLKSTWKIEKVINFRI